ncbi:MAG: GNAT family N-acetyltransferase [Chloroflexi bacterium]|nr:GNAT family N-acetyltransferase [Chloroflexota bacterium]
MSPRSTSQPSPARVRDARETDLPRIVELLAQLSPDEPREDTRTPIQESYRRAFRAIEADPRQRLLVVEANGAVAGCASLVIVPNVSHRGRPYAIIENVVVEASERGARLGDALMRYAIERAREAGCYKLSLTSNKRRRDAHRFYERLGFTATHEGFRIDL